jgi:hypothetical protein
MPLNRELTGEVRRMPSQAKKRFSELRPQVRTEHKDKKGLLGGPLINCLSSCMVKRVSET